MRKAQIIDRAGRLREVMVPDKGQPLVRAVGDKLLAACFPAGTAINDAASSSELTLSVTEACVLDRLVAQPTANRIAILDNLRWDGQPLVTGYVPLSIFGPTSLCSPYVGLPVHQQSKVLTTLRNESGGAITPHLGFTAAQAGAPIREPRIIALGGPTLTTIQEAASGPITIPVVKDCILDRLVLDWGGSNIIEADVAVSSVKLNGDEWLSGVAPAALFRADNPYNPRVAVGVRTGDILTVTVKNIDAADDLEVFAGFACM